jgi:hypothetical protein
VVYPDISVLLGSGILHLGDFVPPPLNECTKTYVDLDQPVAKYKRHDNGAWSSLYLDFEVNGAVGVTFNFTTSRSEYPTSGDYGVRIARPNLKGSSDGLNFDPIPEPGDPSTAVFNSQGKFFFRMHVAHVDIRYACTAGMRYFDVVLTCDY